MQISKYSQIILKEAAKKNISYEPIGEAGRMFILKRGKKHTFIYQSLTELISDPAYTISANKFLTDYSLKKGGFPVPKFKLIREYEEAISFLNRHKKVVVKPLSANQGKGITIGVKTEEELREAVNLALSKTTKHKLQKTYSKCVLVEKAVPGDDHRILVIDYKHVFAIKKIPAYVIGNGKNTVKQLISQKNKEKKEHKKKIIIDDVIEAVLFRQGLTLSDVPSKQEKVFVRRTANLSTGGETIDITRTLHPKTKEMAIQAAKYLKLRVSGFDFMCRDHREEGGFFIEVNPIPSLLLHHFPHQGEKRNPSKKIVEMLISHKLI
jgi:cyanophycin synthetase